MKNCEIIPYIERASTWSLSSIIWTYDSFVIINSGIKRENKRFSVERKKKTLISIS